MKTKLISLTLICILTLSGCATLQTNVSKWWASPTTQAGIKIAEHTIIQALVAGGINVAQQELTTGKIDWTQAGLTAGATAVRQLELTPGAGSAAAITQNVLTVVQDPSQAKAIAIVVVDSVAKATANGADPSGALEGAAQGLDKAAATVKAQTPTP